MLVLRLTDFGFELLAFFQQEKQHLILDFDRFHQQRMPVGPQSGMVHLLEQLVLLQLLLALLGFIGQQARIRRLNQLGLLGWQRLGSESLAGRHQLAVPHQEVIHIL